MEETEGETVLAVYTIVARVPKSIGTGWSVYAIDTKGGWIDDIVESNVMQLEGEVQPHYG